jgi:hypothetical protein
MEQKKLTVYDIAEEMDLAQGLKKWAEELYEEGFDTFVECYDTNDFYELIEEVSNCATPNPYQTLEQRCKLHMAWLAELWEEAADNQSWDGAEHR